MVGMLSSARVDGRWVEVKTPGTRLALQAQADEPACIAIADGARKYDRHAQAGHRDCGRGRDPAAGKRGHVRTDPLVGTERPVDARNNVEGRRTHAHDAVHPAPGAQVQPPWRRINGNPRHHRSRTSTAPDRVRSLPTLPVAGGACACAPPGAAPTPREPLGCSRSVAVAVGRDRDLLTGDPREVEHHTRDPRPLRGRHERPPATHRGRPGSGYPLRVDTGVRG